MSVFRRNFQSLSSSTGLRQSLSLISGNIFSQGLSAIAIILITRQLGPTKFGEFSVGFALLLILTRFMDLGTTFVVQKYGAQATSHHQTNKIFSYALKVKLISALSVAVIGLVVSDSLSDLIGFQHPTIIYAAFILAAATSLFELLQAMLQSLHRFTQSVVANVIQASSKVLGAVALLITGGTASLPIFIWYMISPLVPVLFFKRFFPNWLQLNPKADLKKEHQLSRSLASHAAFGFFAAGIIENIDILFVQGYLNTYETGLLGGVSRIALLFNLMAYSLANVLNPRVAKYTNRADLLSFIKKAWLVVTASLAGFLAFLPFARYAIIYTIGEAYLPGINILIVLMASAFLSIAVMPFIAIFFSIDKPWYFSVSGLLQLVIIVGGNMLYVPTFGLEAAAWTRLVARVSLFVFTVMVVMFALRSKRKQRRVA